MKNNNYVLYYKVNENDYWHSVRPDLPFEQWEDYATKQGYAKYNVTDYKNMDAWQIHQTSDVVRYRGRYYMPEEEIPYPKYDAKYSGKFNVSMEWEDEDDFFVIDYDEIYKGLDELSTLIDVNFSIENKFSCNVGVYAQDIITDIPEFLEKLKKNNHAIYINEELSPFKWLTWIKDEKVRLIQQSYLNKNVKTDFDIILNKTDFFDICDDLVKKMQEYADKDMKRYEEYIEKKYGK